MYRTGKSLATGFSLDLEMGIKRVGVQMDFRWEPRAEIYDAEIVGLRGGLQVALTSPIDELLSGNHICPNNFQCCTKSWFFTKRI